MKRLYNHSSIEDKWNKLWSDQRLHQDTDLNVEESQKFYCLDMFPYPSGYGLHVGHWRGYVLSDYYARYQQLQGKTVLHPMGFDSFGLPAENAAIKNQSKPQQYTEETIKRFTEQLKKIGATYDWSKAVVTSSPSYYRWTQWLFLQFYRHGLAEKRLSQVNWCPKDQTVLANEQVVNGQCERCGTTVTKKELAQWYLKTSAFAQDLLDGLDEVNWPERIKLLQRNWIGKSEGAEINFQVGNETITVFTTRPDTLFGVTALVLAPEHPMIGQLVSADQEAVVEAYLREVKSKTNIDRQAQTETEKTAVFTGSYASHPVTNEQIPIWTADYVLMEYGTGAVMSVPAHDERDYQFAKTHQLPIKVVIEPETGSPRENEEFRRSIVAVVEDPKTGKFLSVNWGSELGGNLFIGGGLEEGEDPIKTAIREIAEETGYTDVEFVSQTETIHHHYRAYSKNVNRYIDAIGLYFKLRSDQRANQRLEQDEDGKFTVEWLTKAEASTKVVEILHKYVFDRLVIDRIYTGAGILTDSAQYSGLTSEVASQQIVDDLAAKGLGKHAVTYRLRDWLVSRQRYWGAPIPIVYDPEGQPHPVKEEHLPLLLPTDVDFLPGGESPIARSKEYLERAEQLYGQGWHFETDTLDTFVDSSWYYLRYLSPTADKQAFDPDLVNRWLPVDLYIGGVEHATLHLLYARFVTRFLAKYGYIDSNITEPFKQLYSIGSVTMHGSKMSKSKGNVAEPDPLIEHYGTDALRGYELFLGPMDIEAEWNTNGINGIHRFLIKLNEVASRVSDEEDPAVSARFAKYMTAINPMIDEFRLNTALSEAMKFVNDTSTKQIGAKTFKDFLVTLSPVFPYLTQELWAELGGEGNIVNASWPIVENKAISHRDLSVRLNHKHIGLITVDGNETEAQIRELVASQAELQQKLGAEDPGRVIYKPGLFIDFLTK